MAGLPMLALFGVEVTHADPAGAVIKLSDGRTSPGPAARSPGQCCSRWPTSLPTR
jgi:hypothetical protein